MCVRQRMQVRDHWPYRHIPVVPQISLIYIWHDNFSISHHISWRNTGWYTQPRRWLPVKEGDRGRVKSEGNNASKERKQEQGQMGKVPIYTLVQNRLFLAEVFSCSKNQDQPSRIFGQSTAWANEEEKGKQKKKQAPKAIIGEEGAAYGLSISQGITTIPL